MKVKFYKWLITWSQRRYQDAKDTEAMRFQLRVTDHALLRYFERVEGYDLGRVRQKLLQAGLGHNTHTFYDGKHIVGRLTLVIKNKHILTLYPNTKNASHPLHPSQSPAGRP